MKKIYITVIALFVASTVIFLSSFVYLDKNKRKTYYYTVNSDGHNIGTIKVEEIVTEDKLIYKSLSRTPLHEITSESRSKIVYNRKYSLESYACERTRNGAVETISIERQAEAMSFMSRLNSRFAYLKDIAVRKETYMFEEDSPVTYLPIIENYDFSRGRSQGFSALTAFSDWENPPMKRFVTLTSIKDEYLKIDRRKIKTENLILKIKNYPNGSIWVAKSDRSLIMIELPSRGLRITRAFFPKESEPQNRGEEVKNYISRDVIIKSGPIDLSGTFTAPLKEGRYPAILFVGPEGPEDRNYRGVFSQLAQEFSNAGFATLRFDKRGVGSSGGSLASLSESDELGDLDKALEVLSLQQETDPEKLFLLAHSRGSFAAMKLISGKSDIKGLILMAPELYSRYGTRENFANYNDIYLDKAWSQDYSGSVIKTIELTRDKAVNSMSGRSFILWKRCFAVRVKEESEAVPSIFLKKTTVPVLILQGREDTAASMETSSMIDKTLEECGNHDHVLTYYSYLGRFFGRKVSDGTHRACYTVDKGVIDNITSWIAKMAFKTVILPQETAK